mmetsp:Transcript_4068/g.10236  ORF Transcript_4068/g.10236 Transcript_4068/m.10236 type:complete len:99 (-) Transcript_4068:51-347(-)
MGPTSDETARQSLQAPTPSTQRPRRFEDSSGKLMMLPSDIALVWDKTFRAYVILYSKDEEQFFKDFSRAFGKLLALGTKQNAAAAGGPLDGLRKLFGL